MSEWVVERDSLRYYSISMVRQQHLPPTQGPTLLPPATVSALEGCTGALGLSPPGLRGGARVEARLTHRAQSPGSTHEYSAQQQTQAFGRHHVLQTHYFYKTEQRLHVHELFEWLSPGSLPRPAVACEHPWNLGLFLDARTRHCHTWRPCAQGNVLTNPLQSSTHIS